MKKVLILAYDFPPYFSMGAQRPWSWYLYFKPFGFEPVVITRHWDKGIKTSVDTLLPSEKDIKTIEESENGIIIRVPNKPGLRDKILIQFGKSRFGVFRKILSFLNSFLQFISFRFDGKSEIYFAAREYLKNNEVEFIIASGEPFILFRYASLLSKDFQIPWAADYRDCWSNMHEITGDSAWVSGVIKKHGFGYFEKRIVKSAEFITCPGNRYKEKINELFIKKEIFIIYNGYFEEEAVLEDCRDKPKNEFVISFGGTLYPFQPFEIFSNGLQKYLNQSINKVKIKVFFYGGSYEEAQKTRLLSNKRLSQYFEVTKRIPREMLLGKYMSSDLLLLFANRKLISGKLFDYIKAKKPILLIGGDGGEMEEIFNDLNLGCVCRNSDEVANFFHNLANHNFKLKLSRLSKNNKIENYSRRRQAYLLSKRIKNSISGKIKEEHQLKTCPVCKNREIKELLPYKDAFLSTCKGCGFVFSRKIPSEKELVDYYSKYSYGENYYSSPLTKYRYQKLLDKMEPYRKNNRILDIGCGNGDFLLVARERGWDCWGTEFSETAVEMCKRKGLKVFKGTLKDLIAELSKFDIITSFEVIEHINTPREEIMMVKELLRKGGIFYVTTPNFNSLMRLLLRSRYDAIIYPEHLGYFSPKTLSLLCSEAGLKLVKLTSTGLSINRFINSMFARFQTPYSPNSIDERFRIALESKWIFRIFKNIIDWIFSSLGIGLSLKGWFVKEL